MSNATPEANRSYTYHYVPRDEFSAYVAGERRAACMSTAKPWDGSNSEPGDAYYVVLAVEVDDWCACCGGAGKVADKRRKRVLFATVTCKACKGRGSWAVLPAVSE